MCSPITSTIWSGQVKDGKFIGAKHDVTDSALTAVAQLLVQTDQSMEFEMNGKKYLLTAKEL